MDNFYSRSQLFLTSALNDKIFSCETIRPNRLHLNLKIKESFKKIKVKRSQSSNLKKKEAQQFTGRRSVNYSLYFLPFMGMKVCQHQSQSHTTRKNMHGVDYFNHVFSYYGVNHKCKRWYKVVFFNLLKVMVCM